MVAIVSSGFIVLVALGVIWSEVVERDNESLELDVVVLAPSVDRGDIMRSDFPEEVEAEYEERRSLALSHLDLLRCHSLSHVSRLTSDRANILALVCT